MEPCLGCSEASDAGHLLRVDRMLAQSGNDEHQSIAAIVVACLCAVLTLVLGAVGGLLPYWLAGEPICQAPCCGCGREKADVRHISSRGRFQHLQDEREDRPSSEQDDQLDAGSSDGGTVDALQHDQAPLVDPAWISLANCFAGGVLLSAGYAHFLPDVVRSALALGIEDQPLPFLFPLLGLLLPFALDGMTACGPEVAVGAPTGEAGRPVAGLRGSGGSIEGGEARGGSKSGRSTPSGSDGGIQSRSGTGGVGERGAVRGAGAAVVAVHTAKARHKSSDASQPAMIELSDSSDGHEDEAGHGSGTTDDQGSNSGNSGSNEQSDGPPHSGTGRQDSQDSQDSLSLMQSSRRGSQDPLVVDPSAGGSHRREIGSPVGDGDGHIHLHPLQGLSSPSQAGGHGHSHGAAAAALATGQGGLGTALVLVLSLSVHSLLEGVGIGVQTEVAAAVAIGMAVSAHKGFAAFAMGTSLRANAVGYGAGARLVLVFAAMTPVGILLGIVLKAGLQSPWVDLVSTGLAQGTFVYVAVVEILREELQVDGPGGDSAGSGTGSGEGGGGGAGRRGDPKARWLALSIGIAMFVVLGYALPSD